jgi:hypothetical protein
VDGTAEWTGKTRMTGADVDAKLTVTKKSASEVHLSGSVTGSGFNSTSEIDCKK